jgi:hypothetical protein
MQEEFTNGLLFDAKCNNKAIVYKRKFRGGVPLDRGGEPRLYVDTVSACMNGRRTASACMNVFHQGPLEHT